MAFIAPSVPKESINGSGIGTHDSHTLAALCGHFSTLCSIPRLIYLLGTCFHFNSSPALLKLIFASCLTTK